MQENYCALIPRRCTSAVPRLSLFTRTTSQPNHLHAIGQLVKDEQLTTLPYEEEHVADPSRQLGGPFHDTLITHSTGDAGQSQDARWGSQESFEVGWARWEGVEDVDELGEDARGQWRTLTVRWRGDDRAR